MVKLSFLFLSYLPMDFYPLKKAFGRFRQLLVRAQGDHQIPAANENKLDKNIKIR